MPQLFGTDGIRGRVFSNNVNPSIFLKVGVAFSEVCKESDSNLGQNENKRPFVLVASDGRSSCDVLLSSLKAGIMSNGVDVWDCGILTTPAISFLVSSYKACGGAIITASHNPYSDNGVKFFNSNGEKISTREQTKIEELIDVDILPQNPTTEVAFAQFGRIIRPKLPIATYLSNLLSSVTRLGVVNSDVKIMLDCANGASSRFAKFAIESLGARVIPFANTPNGVNINSNCGSVYPEFAAEVILANKADIGFCLDGDGDRLVVIDECGMPINGDHLLGFCARYLNQRGMLQNNAAVVTIASNYALTEFLSKNSINVFESQVGDRLVCAKMLECGAFFGGEESGHLIFSKFAKVGDGLLAAIIILTALTNQSGGFLQKPSIALRPFKLINSLKGNIDFTKSLDDHIHFELGRIGELFSTEAKQKGGKVVIRKSGTENKIRIIVEAYDQKFATSLFSRIREELERLLNKGE